MRIDRVLISNRVVRHGLVLLVLVGCKAASVTSTTAEYSEDLSAYRQPIAISSPDTIPDDMVTVDSEALGGDIGSELDSVLVMIVDRNTTRNSWDGYTIQMYSGLSREEAYSARDKAETLELDLDPKIEYYQPNYRVKGGRFFDRLEAYRTYKQVKSYFPSALLLPTKMPLTINEDD